jgi:hypothetical protein
MFYAGELSELKGKLNTILISNIIDGHMWVSPN